MSTLYSMSCAIYTTFLYCAIYPVPRTLGYPVWGVSSVGKRVGYATMGTGGV